MFTKRDEVTEVECCQGRTLEPGFLPIGSLACPKCGEEPWMAHGIEAFTETGFSLFFPLWRGGHEAADRFEAAQAKARAA